MFKKPHNQTLFKEPVKQLKEEKLLIKILKNKYRQQMTYEFKSDNPDVEPTHQELEEALDFFIEKLRGEGVLKKMLDEYLQVKIAGEKQGGSYAPR